MVPQSLHGEPRAFYTKIDKMIRDEKKGKFLGLLVRSRLIDGILMGTKVDRFKIKLIKIGVFK